MSGFIPGREEGKREAGGGGREGGVVPWGLNRNHTHTHIITHLNGTIVVRKPHNCEFGGAVLPDLKVYMVVLASIDSWNLLKA